MTKQRDKDRAEMRAERKQARKQGRAKGSARDPKTIFKEYAKAIGSAVLIALILRQFLFQAFRIPSGSMLETLQIGDYLFVNKFLYGARTPTKIKFFKWTIVDDVPHLRLPGLTDPKQGDIIVFEYPEDRNLDYIKRCVAVAGDTVQIKDGILYVNSEVYESNFGEQDGDHSCIPDFRGSDTCPEPRSKRDYSRFARGGRMMTRTMKDVHGPFVVPQGHIFMMGDNRYNSRDSRYWGPLDVDLIKGKAMFIYWSWDWSIGGDKHWPRINRIGDIIR